MDGVSSHDAARRAWLRRLAIGGLAVGGMALGHGPAMARPSGRSPASAPPMPLPTEWVDGDDPAGWLVSEKVDGVRALWDGQRLRFRSGREVAAPAGFLARLPAEPLDGELWLARGRFDELSGLVRRTAADPADWASVRFMVFELPGAEGPFEQRARQLLQIVRRVGWSQLIAIDQRAVSGAAALRRELDTVVRSGGECLVLHRANAPFVAGRTQAVRKLKPVSDAEAVVVAQRPGQGQFAGQMGALQVRAADGRVFDIGTGFDAATRARPPAVGQRITYTHRGLTGQGLPRFASYLRPAPEF
jgi:DNA ligase-1